MMIAKPIVAAAAAAVTCRLSLSKILHTVNGHLKNVSLFQLT